MELESVILECADEKVLADFYSKLTGWPIVLVEEEEAFIRLQSPKTGVGIACQRDEDYVPPIWPSGRKGQQMMAHLDFGVEDKEEMQAMVEKAVALGATIPEVQYGGEEWITLLDPEGHPFCFVYWD